LLHCHVVAFAAILNQESNLQCSVLTSAVDLRLPVCVAVDAQRCR
jgi:hypothetical protein